MGTVSAWEGKVARDSAPSPSLGSAPEQGGPTPTWALERLEWGGHCSWQEEVT